MLRLRTLGLIAVGLSCFTSPREGTAQSSDSTLPPENHSWVERARATGYGLTSLTPTDRSELAFLRTVIGDRRIVQLGESAHGLAEFNTAKITFIQFLHQEMGFDVIALESSLFECHYAYEHANGVSAVDLMRNCVFGNLHSRELLPLFAYILATRDTDRPLRLTGFDVQSSSRTARRRPGFWRDVIGPVDPRLADSVAAMDSTFLAIRFRADTLAPRAADLTARYARLEQYLEDRAGDLVRAGVARDDLAMAGRLAYSTVRNLEQLTSTGVAFTHARDRGMADNLRWLADEFFPEARIITWGHNFHLRHRNDAVSPDTVKTMGQWLAETHRSQMYTIGLYMRRGRGVMPNGAPYTVAPPSSGSLESILGHVGAPVFFIDLRRTGAGAGGEWVHRPIGTLTWGQAEVRMTLAEQYDGVLLIDRVSPHSVP